MQILSRGGLFRYPLGVALDAQNRIAFANECGPNRLLRLAGGILSPITSNNDIDVLGVTPERMALDPAGNFLVSDFSVGDGDGGIVRVNRAPARRAWCASIYSSTTRSGIASVVNRPPSAALNVAPRGGRGQARAARRRRLEGDPEGLRTVYEWDLNGDGEFEAGSGETAAVIRNWTSHGPLTVRMP